MRRLQSSLVVLLLALAGCAADTEPEAEPAPPASARVPAPLTSAEVAAYKLELSQIFAKQTNPTAQRTARGTVAQVEGQGNVALVKFDGAGGLATTCAGTEDEAVRFLTTNDGLEVK